MKKQLNSTDIHFLASELNTMLASARVDKAYQLGEKELKLRVYAPKAGSIDLVIAPDYICASRFPRKAPETPSTFAMQLRKRIGGSYVRSVAQHGFDRIIEIVLEKDEKRFRLISELFSRGNVILCDWDGKILGLLEWQKWKDRKLGVGQVYEYPPPAKDPFGLDFQAFRNLFSSSEKKAVSVLATDAGLGGTYAEESCRIAGIDRDVRAKDLSNSQMDAVFEAFRAVRDRILGDCSRPCIIYREGEQCDVVPFELSIYEGWEKRDFPSFNEAVDEYFSRQEYSFDQAEKERRYLAELSKLEEIEGRQKQIISKFESETDEYKKAGDVIYQKYSAIEQIMGMVKDARSKGFSWEEISEKLAGKEVEGLVIESVSKDGYAFLSVKKIDS